MSPIPSSDSVHVRGDDEQASPAFGSETGPAENPELGVHVMSCGRDDRFALSYRWRAGIAAWLGWMFDGLDMHLYTLVAAPFVAALLHADSAAPAVKEKSGLIQGAFLVGWAVGGSLFGRISDRLGRTRALMFTILTYAAFTGLSALSQNWVELLIFRFLAALGIGGEWAVGSSLLSETWPARLRSWVAAVLQTGVNIGVLIAALTVTILAKHQRYVFVVGVLPALLVFWIRRAVPEPETWQEARSAADQEQQTAAPGLLSLFQPSIVRTTLLTVGVCSLLLTAWWAFLFWYPQHLRDMSDLQSWDPTRKQRLVNASFFAVIGWSIVGNFFAAGMARWLGYRRAIAVMCLGFASAIVATYWVQRGYVAILWLTPWVGFFSGIFALFTMYLPPLFPTLLRSTGAGFCYNIGRLAAAVGTVSFGFYTARSHELGNETMRHLLLLDGLIVLPAIGLSLMLPDLKDIQVLAASPIGSD